MADTSNPVHTSIEDGVAVVRIDDGKANAVSHAMLEGLHAALDHASADAHSLAFIGRDGKFSAGFDLAVMARGAEATRGLMKAGGEFFMRLYTHPQPTVAAVTGHAVAGGALFCLSCDTRIGSSDIPAKIGLNETAIGVNLPWYGVRLSEARLSMRFRTRAVLHSELFDMAGACDAGYLDELVAGNPEAAAIDRARTLGQLPASSYGFAKRRLRGALAEEILAGIDADMTHMEPPPK